MSKRLMQALLFAAAPVLAQQGPVVTSQLNSTYFVKQVAGFYPTIQSAVTKACAETGAQVVIPAGSTPPDSVAAVTGGCTTARVVDERGGTAAAAVYAWNGSQYVAVSSGAGGGMTALTGAVTGAGTGSVVTTITPTGVTAGSYNLGGQVVGVNAAGQITAIGNPFGLAMASCSACGTYEIGHATANPATFTLSYANGTPASASITDRSTTDTLTSPYTSGSIAVAYCTVAQGQTGFTFTASATATNSQTASAQAGISCLPRNFGGVGAGGASSSVTASGNTAVLSNAAVLGDGGLNPNPAGQTFGAFTPNGQKIYLLLVGGSHTFKDASSGFAFAFNAPTAVSFVNQNGATVSMYLYESTNTLSGSYSVLVVN